MDPETDVPNATVSVFPVPTVQPPAPRPGFASLTPEELLAAGKAMRDKVPRAQHAHWKAPTGRADPVKLLGTSDPERLPELVPIRYGRMLVSPFTFYRGSAAVMAADLAKTPTTGIKVQACGDCHLMNFGGFATPERNIIFDINDFDETLPAPWEWDVKRLAASMVLAARSLDLPDTTGRETAVACTRSYRKRLREYAAMTPLESWYERVTAEDFMETLPNARQVLLRKRIKKATQQTGSELDFPKLAQITGGEARISDTPPLIFHPEVSRVPEFRGAIEKVFAAYQESLPKDRRSLLNQYRILDAAIKVVGIGSVGRRCWIALLMSSGNHPIFLQFKEAVASVLEPYAGKSEFPHHGQRVVEGQRLTQPASDIFLGWVTGANGVQFYVRQLRDAKIKPLVETFGAEELLFYAKACGWVLARAHSKAMDTSMIAGYLGGSDEFDDAIGKFAVAYANQAERDYAALKAAVRKGQIEVFRETA
ncbi:MAG TPA: DUF2252 domain-containing protein [Stellaceae bacterium]|nr:DUF2252 domain-containing protein [Stellaceae bacterium]